MRSLNNQKIIKGIPASPGKISGRAFVVKTDKDRKKMKPGDILVVSVINLKLFPTLKHKAAGFIAGHASITSHIATVAREAKKPCIVRATGCLKTLKSGMRVELDGSKGTVKIL
jgi:pyruvate, water dikinase